MTAAPAPSMAGDRELLVEAPEDAEFPPVPFPAW